MQQGLNDETLRGLVEYSVARSPAPKRWHITRLAMYRALEAAFSRLDGSDRRCLSISHSRPLGAVLGLNTCEYVEADHPEHDLTHLGFPDGSFDFCISDQVLEHVQGDPFTAFAESVRVLKPGGWLCHTTCFINHVHAAPSDFWRFTPEALELLAQRAGCTDISAAGWGNREAWGFMDAGYRFLALPEEPGHPLYDLATRNDPLWPIVVWVTARKQP